jgi:hypothetical protein
MNEDNCYISSDLDTLKKILGGYAGYSSYDSYDFSNTGLIFGSPYKIVHKNYKFALLVKNDEKDIVKAESILGRVLGLSSLQTIRRDIRLTGDFNTFNYTLGDNKTRGKYYDDVVYIISSNDEILGIKNYRDVVDRKAELKIFTLDTFLEACPFLVGNIVNFRNTGVLLEIDSVIYDKGEFKYKLKTELEPDLLWTKEDFVR